MQNMPFIIKKRIQIDRIGRDIVLRTAIGLTVVYDLNTRVEVGLPETFKGKVSGKKDCNLHWMRLNCKLKLCQIFKLL